MPGPDLYAVLGLGRTATGDEVKKAYKQLALKYHPDRCGGTGDEQKFADKFKEIGGAYEILGDAQRRAKYDRERDQAAMERRTMERKQSFEIRPTGPVRKPFQADCLDGMTRTFDVDPSAFPSNLCHGDTIIVGGDAGTVLGVAEDSVWWWKNGCLQPSRVGSRAQFSLDAQVINPIKWRKTGNAFQAQTNKSRMVELERKRRETFMRFKEKRKHKEKRDAQLRKREEHRAKLAHHLGVVSVKQTKRRHQLELVLLLQLGELHARMSFETRVAEYAEETRKALKSLLQNPSGKPGADGVGLVTPVPRIQSTRSLGFSFGSGILSPTTGTPHSASLEGSFRGRGRLAESIFRVEEEDEAALRERDLTQSVEIPTVAEAFSNSSRSNPASSSSPTSSREGDASATTPILRFGKSTRAVHSPPKDAPRSLPRDEPVAGDGLFSPGVRSPVLQFPASGGRAATTTMSTPKAPEMTIQKKRRHGASVTPGSGAAPRGAPPSGVTSPLFTPPFAPPASLQKQGSTPASDAATPSYRSVSVRERKGTASATPVARGDPAVPPADAYQSRFAGASPPPPSRGLWCPPPAADAATPSDLSSGDDGEDPLGPLGRDERSEMAWCNDKLFSEYKAFLAGSRSLRENWEKESSRIEELGDTLTGRPGVRDVSASPPVPSVREDPRPASRREAAAEHRAAHSPPRFAPKPVSPAAGKKQTNAKAKASAARGDRRRQPARGGALRPCTGGSSDYASTYQF
eukprot:TRINITY_DN5116_c0_g1_i1.p1 TRINITY_DN5116_c0_g1~~TRINITY_DN5116_c0_g1_i1.p1  ORF type:complete len:773 (+),score=250.99 TRINITY_DN5116_c0_g1_i1:83-2320(+)